MVVGRGTSLMAQWLRLRVSNAGGMGSTPGQGTKIPHARQHGEIKFFLILMGLISLKKSGGDHESLFN